MPRSRSRPKKHSKSNRVSVKSNHKKIPRPSAFDRSKLDYDPKETQFANYQKLGLLYDANQIGAERKHIKGFKPRVKGPSAEPAAPGDVHQLELEVPEGLKTVKKVPEGEHKVLSALIERHGDDYTAMARDMKLNAYQHTAAHLRRRIAKMQSEDAEEAAEAAAAVALGKQAPPPRLRKKITKNPNKAFSKKSMNFT